MSKLMLRKKAELLSRSSFVSTLIFAQNPCKSSIFLLFRKFNFEVVIQKKLLRLRFLKKAFKKPPKTLPELMLTGVEASLRLRSFLDSKVLVVLSTWPEYSGQSLVQLPGVT